MYFRFGWRALLGLFLLIMPAMTEEVPAHLREAAASLSKTYTINYDETRQIVLNLPEGYLARRVESVGEDVILCPWNEYFIISSSRLPTGSDVPVQDEAAMTLQMDELEKAHKAEGGEVKERKVWMGSKGPLGSLEVWSKGGKTMNAGSVLLYPVGTELWIFSLVGLDSALADTKLIQNLILEELNK